MGFNVLHCKCKIARNHFAVFEAIAHDLHGDAFQEIRLDIVRRAHRLMIANSINLIPQTINLNVFVLLLVPN